MYETGGSEDMMQDATCFRKSVKPRSSEDSEKWIQDDVTNTLNNFENTDIRTSEAIVYRNGGFGEMTEGVGTLRANGGDAGGN